MTAEPPPNSCLLLSSCSWAGTGDTFYHLTPAEPALATRLSSGDTNQRPVFMSRDLYWPIRAQHWPLTCHLATQDQKREREFHNDMKAQHWHHKHTSLVENQASSLKLWLNFSPRYTFFSWNLDQIQTLATLRMKSMSISQSQLGKP